MWSTNKTLLLLLLLLLLLTPFCVKEQLLCAVEALHFGFMTHRRTLSMFSIFFISVFFLTFTL